VVCDFAAVMPPAARRVAVRYPETHPPGYASRADKTPFIQHVNRLMNQSGKIDGVFRFSAVFQAFSRVPSV
jgi:hypothetical protein